MEAAVQLTLFDLAGQRVIVLLTGRRAAGRHIVSWNGRDAEGRAVATGIYLACLYANGLAQQRLLTLIH